MREWRLKTCPLLYPLLRTRSALGAFTALFRGTDEDILVRLMVLREIGYITSQLAAGQALGKVSDEDLQHLFSRLMELEDEFGRAVLSGSELCIRSAEKKLTFVLNWVEKGTEIMKAIAADQDFDEAIHRIARKIGQVQSLMLRMSSVFQRTLNQLERQKVRLGSEQSLHFGYPRLAAHARKGFCFSYRAI